MRCAAIRGTGRRIIRWDIGNNRIVVRCEPIGEITLIIANRVGVILLDFVLHELLRAAHSRNSASIRILVQLSLHFILIEGRVIKFLTHYHASMTWVKTFDTVTQTLYFHNKNKCDIIRFALKYYKSISETLKMRADYEKGN